MKLFTRKRSERDIFRFFDEKLLNNIFSFSWNLFVVTATLIKNGYWLCCCFSDLYRSVLILWIQGNKLDVVWRHVTWCDVMSRGVTSRHICYGFVPSSRTLQFAQVLPWKSCEIWRLYNFVIATYITRVFIMIREM